MYGQESSQPDSSYGRKKDTRRMKVTIPMPIKASLYTILLLAACFTALHACSVFQKTYLKSLIIKKNTDILSELKKCIYDRTASGASLCTNGSVSPNSEILNRDDYGNLLIKEISVTGFDTNPIVSQNTDIARITVKIKKSVFYPAGEKHYAVQLTPESNLFMTDMSDANYREHFEKPSRNRPAAVTRTDYAPSFYWKRAPYRNFATHPVDERIELLAALPDDEYGINELLSGELLLEKGERGKALAHYRSSAEKGNGAALLRLAKLHLDDYGDDGNVTAGLKYLKQAAELNNTEALNLLGNLYTEGRHVARDPKTAEALFRKAADNGSGEGYYNLGRLLMYGKSSSAAPDMRKACSAFRSARDLHYKGQDIYAALGDCLMYLDSDIIGAYRFYRKGADLNQPLSLLRVAHSLMLTDDTDKRKLKKAELLLLKAADQNQPEAYGSLGRLYLIAENNDAAYEYARKGTAHKDPLSMEILADLLMSGKGPSGKDSTESTGLLIESALKGNVSAMDKLIILLGSSESREDMIKATAWIRRSMFCHDTLDIPVKREISAVSHGLKDILSAAETKKAESLYRNITENSSSCMLTPGTR